MHALILETTRLRLVLMLASVLAKHVCAAVFGVQPQLTGGPRVSCSCSKGPSTAATAVAPAPEPAPAVQVQTTLLGPASDGKLWQ
eukprot:343944-Pelagomonas_calceolata.AAC.6